MTLENKIHELKEKGIAPLELSLVELVLDAFTEQEREELKKELNLVRTSSAPKTNKSNHNQLNLKAS